MSRTTPIAAGETLPPLTLIDPSGSPAALKKGERTLLYFMRTASCPICNAHVRKLETLATASGPVAPRTLVIVPGGADDAAKVARKHPGLAGRVVSSETAHAALGLFVTLGMQQSGTFVVGADGVIASARTATIPAGAFNEAEAIAALG